jgi:hypothetical protein
MTRKTFLFFSLFLLATLLVSLSIAQILLNKPVTQKGNIAGSADLKVIREDNFEEILQIDWGSFIPPTVISKTSLEILQTRICLKNVGNVPLVVAWNCSNLPSYLTISATWSGNPYPPNDFSQFRIDPGYVNGYIVFNLTLNDLNTPAQPFEFIINFWGAEA